jgi:hypothetical protein
MFTKAKMAMRPVGNVILWNHQHICSISLNKLYGTWLYIVLIFQLKKLSIKCGIIYMAPSYINFFFFHDWDYSEKKTFHQNQIKMSCVRNRVRVADPGIYYPEGHNYPCLSLKFIIISVLVSKPNNPPPSKQFTLERLSSDTVSLCSDSQSERLLTIGYSRYLISSYTR